MRKLFLLLIVFSVALGGCGDVEWFPEQGVSQFSFDSANDVSPGATVTSNTITVQTPNATENISVSGGEFSIGGGEFTSTAATVKNGDQVAVRHQASLVPGAQTETTLTIGGKSGRFRSTTGVPVEFDPPIIVNAAPATERTSSEETVVLSGGSAPISVTGGSYSIDGGAFVATTGTVQNGQTVRVRQTTAAAGSTGAAATKITELTIGQMKSTFTTSITAAATVAVQGAGTTGTELILEVPSLVSGTFNLGVQESSTAATVSLTREEQSWDTPPKEVTLKVGQPIFVRETIFPSTAVIAVSTGSTPVQLIELTTTAQ